MDKRFFHDRDEDGRRGFHCDTNRS
jgi:hypothetical protein